MSSTAAAPFDWLRSARPFDAHLLSQLQALHVDVTVTDLSGGLESFVRTKGFKGNCKYPWQLNTFVNVT